MAAEMFNCVSVCVLTLFVVDAAYSQVTNSTSCQVTRPPDKVAQSLTLGRDDLYIVTEVPQLKYELEVRSRDAQE